MHPAAPRSSNRMCDDDSTSAHPQWWTAFGSLVTSRRGMSRRSLGAQCG